MLKPIQLTNIGIQFDTAVLDVLYLRLDTANDPLTAGLEIQAVGTQLTLGSATDYAQFAVAADGLLAITTVDAGAAEGDIALMPDGMVGINIMLPDRLLHVEVFDAGTNAVVFAQRLGHRTSGGAVAGFGTGIEFELEENDDTDRIAGYITCDWEDAGEGASADGRLNFGVMTADAAAATAMSVWNGRVGVQVTTPAAQTHIDQPTDDAAIPVLTLDQADVSDGFINFIGSDRGVIDEGDSSAVSVRVELAGVIYLLALYADA